MADADTFRKAWGKFATGVSVITSIQPDGHVHGMTAQSISSVSLDPLLAMVCIGHNRNSYPLIKDSRHFAINILAEGQRAVAEYYARPPEERAEGEIPLSRTENGSAMIEGCLAYMDCHVVGEHAAGDHTIFIGEVQEIRIGSGDPLLYFDSRFGGIRPMSESGGDDDKVEGTINE